MAYLNKVLLIGNLGKDPEIRLTQNGQKQAKFSLATTEKYRDKASGEMRERTDWHNLVAWRITAEQMERLGVRKGTSMFIEGRLVQRSWDDPSGQKRYATEVEVERFQLLGSRPAGDRPQSGAPSGNGYGSSNYGAPSNSAPSYENMGGGEYDSAAQDDLPF